MQRAAHRVFVYGTLMVPRIVDAVIGRVPRPQAAILSGYRRFTVAGQVYPGIVPCAGAVVEGLLYDGLQAPEMAALDEYEGELYVRHSLTVLVDENQHQAACYVVKPERRHELSEQPWDLAWFEREHADRFGVHWR